MNLLRLVQEERLKARNYTPAVVPINSLPHPTGEINRAYIIEKKPKHKKLKIHFENLIAKIVDEEED